MSNKTCLFIYIRVPYEGEICNNFFRLVELESCTGADICDILLKSLDAQGISEDMLRSQLVGFANDGAAAMMVRYRGAAVFLREKINPNLMVIHCMNHKLELVIHDAIKHITDACQFRCPLTLCTNFSLKAPKI